MDIKNQIKEAGDKIRSASAALQKERENAKDLIRSVMKDLRNVHVRPNAYWNGRTDLDRETRDYESLSLESQQVSFYDPEGAPGKEFIVNVRYDESEEEVMVKLYNRSKEVVLFYIEDPERVLRFIENNS